MASIRKIIHIDMDAFFASVEQRDFPEYRGKPVIVGGPPESRGVVAAASYEVRAFGVHSAMSSARAKKLCPEAIFVYPRFAAYKSCSLQIHNIFKRYSDTIEPLSLDEAFLDVTNSRLYKGSATLIASQIKKEIKEELGLTASAGVSYCKFLAKIASDMNKPDGLYLIKPEQAEAFIANLPIRKFFGIGKATEAKMNRLGIYTGADLKQLSKAQLQRYFGKASHFYYDIVRGVDTRPVSSSRQRKSIGKETTFAKDLTDYNDMIETLDQLSEQVSKLMQQKQLIARTLTLKVKYSDFQQITRSASRGDGCYIQQSRDIVSLLPALVAKTEMGKRAVRLLGITVSNLDTVNADIVKPDQMQLFDNSTKITVNR